MTESEFIRTYGEVIFNDFCKFMRGQTCMLEPNGEVFYYQHDIDNYFRSNDERFFD